MKTLLPFLLIALTTITLSATPKTVKDIPYVTAGHERQKLDLYLPESADGPVPLLIWVHGGGWQNGSKENGLPLRQDWTERGYAVASLNYRLSGHAIFPAQIEDCKAAIRWLRAHASAYGLDPDRFGVWGSSAGGHLVALLGTSGEVKELDVGDHLDQSSHVQAVCDYYGPTDFEAFVTRPGYESHASPTSAEAKLLGGAVLENLELAAKANPITHVTSNDPPFLIVHGDKDPVVPIQQSELLFEALKKAEIPVHFHTIKGAAHGQGFSGPEIQPMVNAFFDSHLLATAASPSKEANEAIATESTASAQGERPAGSPNQRPMPSFDEILSRSDKNGDGKIARDEFRGPPAIFERLDKNGDGVVTREEHGAAFPDMPRPAGGTPTPDSTPIAAMDLPEGFTLSGEKWTHREGDHVTSGILVKPEGEGPFPAVLISHGMGGSAAGFGLQKAREMVGWGLVCIAPDYTHAGAARGNPDLGASTENIRRARTCLDWLAKMPDVDVTRMGAYGHSMGGFVTIGLAAAEPQRLKAAAITGSGVSQQDGYAAPSHETANKVRTPFLILHGTADTTVRPEQSASLEEIMNKNEVPNERILFVGEGHPIDQTKREEVFRSIRDWFAKVGILP